MPYRILAVFVGSLPIFLLHSSLPLLVHIFTIWQQICCLPSSFYPSWRLTLSHPVNAASCQPFWRPGHAATLALPVLTPQVPQDPYGPGAEPRRCPGTTLAWSPGSGGRADSTGWAKLVNSSGFLHASPGYPPSFLHLVFPVLKSYSSY